MISKVVFSTATITFGLILVLALSAFTNSLFTEASERFQSALNGDTVATGPIIAGITIPGK